VRAPRDLGGVRQGLGALGDHDGEVERRLVAGLVEAGERAARVVRLELGEGVSGAAIVHPVEPPQPGGEGGLVVDLDLGDPRGKRAVEREHQLLRLVLGAGRHARRRLADRLAVARADPSAVHREPPTVHDDDPPGRIDRHPDAGPAEEGLLRGIDGELEGVTGGPDPRRQSPVGLRRGNGGGTSAGRRRLGRRRPASCQESDG
jgi:hypothetical protein